MNCIQERAKIEKSYSQQLTDWSKRWRQLIDKGESIFFWAGGGAQQWSKT